MGEGEGDACRAGGDNIDTGATVVGKGGAKGESAIPVRGSSVAIGLPSTGDDARNDGGTHVGRPIDSERFVAITEKEYAPSDRPSV